MVKGEGEEKGGQNGAADSSKLSILARCVPTFERAEPHLFELYITILREQEVRNKIRSSCML